MDVKKFDVPPEGNSVSRPARQAPHSGRRGAQSTPSVNCMRVGIADSDGCPEGSWGVTTSGLRRGLPLAPARVAALVRHVAAVVLFVGAVPPTASVHGQTDVAPQSGRAARAAEGRIPNQSYPSNELFTKISPKLGSRRHNQPAVIDGYLLLTGNGVHEFWDISDPYSPVQVSELASKHRSGGTESFQVSYAKFPDGSLYLVTTSGRGIDLWGIDNVHQPVLLSGLELPNINYGDVHHAVWGVAWEGDYIFAGATSNGLYIVDASNPTKPKLVASIPTSELGGIKAGPLFALGNLLVITTPKANAGVVTMDISNPASPILLDFVKPEKSSYIGSFYGGHAHLLNPFRTYDVTTDPSNIRLIGSDGTPASQYMSFADGYLFLGGVRGGSEGIWKYGLGDPSDLKLIGRIPGRNSRWDDQFSVPIGNLIAISDDENVNGYVGSFLAVHATEPDTQPPVVEYSNPPDGAVDQALSSRVALAFSDEIEFTSVDSSTLIVRPIGGQALTGKWGYTQTVVTFWPDQPLQPDTDYEVVAIAGGITDLVGNALANDFRSAFRTGAASTLEAGGIDALSAVTTGQNADFVARPTPGFHQYRWDFGDNHQASGVSVSHAYDAPGRYTVELSVVEPNGRDVFEAEEATLSGGVVVANQRRKFFGAGYADFQGATGPNAGVEWQIGRNSPGDVDVVVRYSNNLGRILPLELVVNGNTIETVGFNTTGSTGRWGFLTIDGVPLDAGTNTVELIAREGDRFFVDRLSLPSETSTLVATHSAIQIVHRPLAATQPARSGTVIVTADQARAWTVNPDAGTVTAVDTISLNKEFERNVGLTPRTLAQAPDGTIWVVNEGSHDISVLDSSNGAVIATIDLPYASMPYGIAFAPDGTAAYVTLQALGQLLRIDPATRTTVHSVTIGPDSGGIVPQLRGIAITSDSRRILATRFVSSGQGGEIYDLAVEGRSLRRVGTLALANDPGPDTPESGRGITNYLSSVVISPDGVHARAPWKKDNIERGLVRDGRALTHDNTVRTGVSQVDLSTSREDLAARVDLDDHDMAFAVAFSPLGDLLFAAIQGSNVVNVIDAHSGASIAGMPTGLAPQGLTLDDQGRLYVQNFMGRSLSGFDVRALLAGTETSATLLREIDLVANETLADDVLLGKRIFYDASSSKMSLDGYISCASCHLDGGHDGRTWDFTDRGEGLRNTTSLRGRGGTLLHGPVHWTGNFDEIQDFENDIRSHFGGTGLMRDDDFNSGTRSDPLGDPKAGLSPELDALAAYVSSLTSVPPSPYRNPDGSLTEEGERGKLVFANEGCGSCHSGAEFTDSALGVLHDVGTIRPASGGRRGRTLPGFDTPTLKGVWATAPYLHDGSAQTLAQAINAHSDVSLSGSALGELVSYLQQIDELAVANHALSNDATLRGLALSEVAIGRFDPAKTVYEATATDSVAATTVTAMPNNIGASVVIESADGATAGSTRDVVLGYGKNTITATVTAADGLTTRTYTVTVTREYTLPTATISAGTSPVSEGADAVFTVRLNKAARDALTVAVSVMETGDALLGTASSVAFSAGDTSATLSVATAEDTVIEADSTVTASVSAGVGYTLGTASSASVTVEDDDEAAFTVSAAPEAIAEGESATLTVAISNGVTFARDQTIALAVSGTASASDYALSPAALTLAAGASSATAALGALPDQREEADETVMLTALHGGVEVGSATVTIASVSHDATLSALGLSGIDIGTFAGGTTAYTASVPHATANTAVTATASNPGATVSIAPGSEVSLAEGANQITVTVTAEDGTTTRSYTVTVTRASLPVVSIVAVAGRVSEGERAEFRVSLTEPATERLRVGMRWSRSDQSQSLTQYTQFHVGMSSKLPSFSKSDDKVVREDLTVSITLEDGAGYRVSEDARSAQVVVEENDAAEFAVSVRPASVAEGGTASVRVRTTNGVTFAADQTIALGFAGSTATKGADYSVSAESLRLRAGRRRVTASLTAIADSDQEGDETVRVEAVHGGAVIGTATLTITGSEPEAEAAGEGFSLAPENSSPSGIWSDGQTAWVADLADARLYAYRREDGERQPDKDIATEPSPMGLWSDGETLWVAQQGGGLKAHRLADGARLVGRDLALEADAEPAGVWSDGETAWVSNWLGDTVYAYSLEDGRRAASRDIQLAGGNLMPAGLWSDGQTLWVADWRERLYAYRLSDGGREPGRDLVAGTGDTDPTGLWSGGGTLLTTSWESGEVRARQIPAVPVQAGRPGKGRGAFLAARAASMPAVPDPALQAAIGAALGKAPGEAVSADELAGLEALAARNRGIRDLSGLERATGLVELDLGFNPLDDLRALVLLPALESLNLDGAAPEPHLLASLQGLRRLSLRNNGIDDLRALATLAGLTELDVGDNLVQDMSPLSGLTALKVLRADRNRVSDLWPLASLAGLEALDLGANQVRDLRPLAGLGRLEVLRLGGNGLSDVHALAGLGGLRELVLADNAVEDLRALSNLAGLRRLDLRGNAARDLRPLAAMPALVWVHVGGSGIADLGPLEGLSGLVVAGQDDREPRATWTSAPRGEATMDRGRTGYPENAARNDRKDDSAGRRRLLVRRETAGRER